VGGEILLRDLPDGPPGSRKLAVRMPQGRSIGPFGSSAEMAELGVTLLSGDPKTVAEEVAFAYTDIEAVKAASASLVRPVRRLTPLGVVKG
jgi:RNA-splicing ligase RtcB